MSEPRILVVDDEPNVCRLVELYLRREGFDVVSAHDGKDALDLFQETDPDLILLDLMLPTVDGWEICRRVREKAPIPVIMLTARGDEIDRVLGLELGADDYITKPFSPRELVLRIKAVLRRTLPGEDEDVLNYPGLTIDGKRRQVWSDGAEVTLTRREFDLLWHLARHEGQAFERDQLLEELWGYDYAGDGRTIDVHVTRIREKIHQSDGAIQYIHTVWGIGYKFQVRDDDA